MCKHEIACGRRITPLVHQRTSTNNHILLDVVHLSSEEGRYKIFFCEQINHNWESGFFQEK